MESTTTDKPRCFTEGGSEKGLPQRQAFFGSCHEVTDGGPFDSTLNRTLSKPKSSLKRSSQTPTSTVPLWRFNSIRQTSNYQRPQTAPHPWGAGEQKRTGGASFPSRPTVNYQEHKKLNSIPNFPKTSNINEAWKARRRSTPNSAPKDKYPSRSTT
jgi:hypothetical protein